MRHNKVHCQCWDSLFLTVHLIDISHIQICLADSDTFHVITKWWRERTHLINVNMMHCSIVQRPVVSLPVLKSLSLALTHLVCLYINNTNVTNIIYVCTHCRRKFIFSCRTKGYVNPCVRGCQPSQQVVIYYEQFRQHDSDIMCVTSQ